MPEDYRGDWDRSSYDGDCTDSVNDARNRAEDRHEEVDGYRGDWDRGGYGSMGDRDDS